MMSPSTEQGDHPVSWVGRRHYVGKEGDAGGGGGREARQKGVVRNLLSCIQCHGRLQGIIEE